MKNEAHKQVVAMDQPVLGAGLACTAVPFAGLPLRPGMQASWAC